MAKDADTIAPGDKFKHDGHLWEVLSYDYFTNNYVVERLSDSHRARLTAEQIAPNVFAPAFTYGSKCECGSAAIYGHENTHSHWCPKYEKY